MQGSNYKDYLENSDLILYLIKIRKSRILNYIIFAIMIELLDTRFQIIKDQRNRGFTNFENCQIFLGKLKYFDLVI